MSSRDKSLPMKRCWLRRRKLSFDPCFVTKPKDSGFIIYSLNIYFRGSRCWYGSLNETLSELHRTKILLENNILSTNWHVLKKTCNYMYLIKSTKFDAFEYWWNHWVQLTQHSTCTLIYASVGGRNFLFDIWTNSIFITFYKILIYSFRFVR